MQPVPKRQKTSEVRKEKIPRSTESLFDFMYDFLESMPPEILWIIVQYVCFLGHISKNKITALPGKLIIDVAQLEKGHQFRLFGNGKSLLGFNKDKAFLQSTRSPMPIQRSICFKERLDAEPIFSNDGSDFLGFMTNNNYPLCVWKWDSASNELVLGDAHSLLIESTQNAQSALLQSETHRLTTKWWLPRRDVLYETMCFPTFPSPADYWLSRHSDTETLWSFRIPRAINSIGLLDDHIALVIFPASQGCLKEMWLVDLDSAEHVSIECPGELLSHGTLLRACCKGGALFAGYFSADWFFASFHF
jgi:hypothetical protein